ncbi:hypothetical protein ATPR_0994 [Acetobacter tropicalis NBRC 101654]|uniref:Uncharacterized protein n=1 Tax=Acetobacter tropicalis NBRC 101654 TaxID=749388 RepID=F7VC95_9PROT|nr:hypothetical protein ATPR_0994 [Acetobacter tropicalis NBRC 101654]
MSPLRKPEDNAFRFASDAERKVITLNHQDLHVEPKIRTLGPQSTIL